MKKLIKLLLIFLSCNFFVACGGGDSAFLDEEPAITALKPGLNDAVVKSQSRGDTKLEVYLPPNWSKDVTTTYPVIFFLHGQGGKQTDFFDTVPSTDFDSWINQGELPSFVFISVQSHYKQGTEQQWSSSENEVFLTSRNDSGLRAFALKQFKAGDDLDADKITKTSIQGHSRGARGAIHYAVKFPKYFASAVADAFVSEYALAEEEANALANKSDFISSGIKLRMSIGDTDSYEQSKHATTQMHNYLDTIGLAHEYEVLPDASHSFYTIWNSVVMSPEINGLYELKYHAQSWK